jgi:homoserine kinase
MTKARRVKSRRIKPFELVLPATSANLGPAFDAAALALDLYLKIQARPAREFSLAAKGRDAAICAEPADNLILNTYREVLQAEGREVVPLALRMQNEIPIGKGCGSSAAARLAGIALAVHFGRLSWNDDEIIAEGSRREHHPDNASACWLGGVTVARMSAGQVQAVRVRPAGQWPLLLAVPEEKLSTQEARRVLPQQYSKADAVANIQNSMLLLAALFQGRHELLATALDDRIHQPYRAPLCPLLPALQELSGQRGILGVALSGAGPSVLIFLDPGSVLSRCRKVISTHLLRQGLKGELIAAAITARGAGRFAPGRKSRT